MKEEIAADEFMSDSRKMTCFEDVVDDFQWLHEELGKLLKFYAGPSEGDENYLSWKGEDTVAFIKELKSGDWASGTRFKQLEESMQSLLKHCAELQKTQRNGQDIFSDLSHAEMDNYIDVLFVDYHCMDAFQIFLENYDREEDEAAELTFDDCWDGMLKEATLPWGTDDLLKYKEFREAFERMFKDEISGWCGDYKYIDDSFEEKR